MEDGKNVLYHGQKQVVHQDELFGLLYTAHIKTGHGGRDAMVKELQGNHGQPAQRRCANLLNDQAYHRHGLFPTWWPRLQSMQLQDRLRTTVQLQKGEPAVQQLLP